MQCSTLIILFFVIPSVRLTAINGCGRISDEKYVWRRILKLFNILGLDTEYQSLSSLNIFFLSEGIKMVAGNFSPTEDMVFGEANVAAIALYFVMFSVGLTTNSLSLYKLLTARLKLKDRSRMTLLLIHLAVADMMVR